MLLKIYIEKRLIMAKKSKNKTKKDSFKGGTKWLHYYTFGKFKISYILLGIIIIMYTAFTFVNFITDIKYIILTVILTLIGLSPTILLLILNIAVCKRMKRMERSGYYLNIVLLVAETLYISYFNYIIFNKSGFLFIISLIFYTLIWWLPNFIYFKKRKCLFINPIDIKETKKNKKYCKKCGDLLHAYDLYCDKCGEKVTV
ncbi:MAG: hypothetical protein K0S55_54 [Clostridia bacterium]|nr:hypothetical protein [Clostridia bacterium]